MATLFDPAGTPRFYSHQETIYDAGHAACYRINRNRTVHALDGKLAYWISDDALWLLAPGGVPSLYFDQFGRENELVAMISGIARRELTKGEVELARMTPGTAEQAAAKKHANAKLLFCVREALGDSYMVEDLIPRALKEPQ